MRARGWSLATMCVLFGTFILVNWSAIARVEPVSLLIMSVEAPLGILLLLACGVVIALVVAYSLQAQIKALSESRRQAAELRSQRELADRAEESRFTDLRNALEREFAVLREQLAETEQRLRTETHESSNGLAAYIGELDERLERQWPKRLTQ